MGNPEPTLLVPSRAARRPARDGGGPPRRVLARGGRRAVALRRRSAAARRCRRRPGTPVDAAVRLEVNRYNGAVEPRLVLRHARPAAPGPIEIAGRAALRRGGARRARARAGAVAATGARPRCRPARRAPSATRRASGIAGLLGDLVASGEPVLAVCAHAGRRAAALRDRVGGFASRPGRRSRTIRPWLRPYAHVVAIDPPAHDAPRALLARAAGRRLDAPRLGRGRARLRPPRARLGARPAGAARRALPGAAQGRPGRRRGARARCCAGRAAPQRTGRLAGRLLRVLAELGLVDVERAPLRVAIPADPGAHRARALAGASAPTSGACEDGRCTCERPSSRRPGPVRRPRAAAA